MTPHPTHWVQVAISEVAQIVSGGTPPSKDEKCFSPPGNGISWITPADLSGYKLQTISHGSRDLSPVGLAACSAKIMPAGAVLFSSRAPIGYVAIASKPIATNQGFKSFVFPDGIDSRFAYHQLKHIRPLAEALATGTTFKELSGSAAAKLPFLVAPQGEQQRIADKLDTVISRVNAVGTRLDRVAPVLKRFRQSVLAAATSGRLTMEWRSNFHQAVDAKSEVEAALSVRAQTERRPPSEPDLTNWNLVLPSKWAVASVHQFAECLDRLRVPIKKDERKAAMGLYPYFGANGEVGRIDEYIFDDELVLVTEDETFYGREKPIAYRVSGKCWVNNHAHVLRAPYKEANDYLCYALMYYNVIPWLSGTTGRAKLTQAALNALPIGVPPKPELIEIVRRVQTLLAFADRVEARLKAAQTATERLLPSLLAKAFRGELVPQDPNDEQASELLRRLRAGAASSMGARRRGAA